MTDQLLKRAMDLRLNGIVAHWAEVAGAAWLPQLLDWKRRSAPRAAWNGGLAQLVSGVQIDCRL